MELLSVAEMTCADALAVEDGGDSFALMQRAGQAVAAAAQRLAPDGDIVVVAGRGNIRASEGPRNAVATGLILAYQRENHG